jgi:hypothetical protein
MKYAVYFKWFDGTEDTFNCDNRDDMLLNVRTIKRNGDQKLTGVSKILKSGEYVPIKYFKDYKDKFV